MSDSGSRKGILLAGGRGTRLYPLTRAVNKQLLPVHDKPMIYYPLATLMTAGVRDILLITRPHDEAAFRRLLGDGGHLGISIRYAQQHEPRGIAEALRIGSDFVGANPLVLALGDNLFVGGDIAGLLAHATARGEGATVFAAAVDDPARYGVVELDAAGRAVALEEKPARPRSNLGVAGLYFYDPAVFDIAAQLQPSPRGELEITDVNRVYLARGSLHVERLPPGVRWVDAGTPESLAEATAAVRSQEAIERRKLGCVEEVAWRQGLISDVELAHLGTEQPSAYGDYLRGLVRGTTE